MASVASAPRTPILVTKGLQMPPIHHVARRLARWSPAVLWAALLAPGCATDDRAAAGAPASAAAPSPAPAAISDLTSRTDDAADPALALGFAPCAGDPELECGQLSVPVDYAHPRGERLALATVRARALTPRRRGILFVNPGGPGGSGVDFVIGAKALFAPLRQSFDIVSFDPRGTARSHSVDCTFEIPPAPADGTLAAAAAFLDEAGARYARACGEQHGALATQVGTNNVARDIDAFRAALGERELNYLGFSYGTILGASYATLFPDRVRAMVLDGNASPSWFGDYLLEFDGDGSAGAELALRRLDQLCRAAADCPLHTTGVIAVYDRVVERLDRNPVVMGDGVITGASVASVVFALLTAELHGWPAIVRVLALADAGDYAALPPVPVDDSPTVREPNALAIICDDSATRRLGLDYLPVQTGTHALYPRFGGTNFGLEITACSSWPQARAVPLKHLQTRNPIVLIGNDFDPRTPMAWSRNMATALGPRATLVRYQGGGHTIYGSIFGGGSACINDAVESYLRDLTAPPNGLTCPAQPLTFAATARRAETATTMAEILQQVTPAPAPPVRRRR